MNGVAIPGPFEELRRCAPLFVEDGGEGSLVVPDGGCDNDFPTRVFTGDTSRSGATCTLTARMQASGCETLFGGNNEAFAHRAAFFFFAIPRDELQNVRFGLITPSYSDEVVTRQLVLPEQGEWFPGPNRASAYIDYEIAVFEDGDRIARKSERMVDERFQAIEGENPEGFDVTNFFRRISLREPFAFFPSGSTDVVIRVTLVMATAATGPVNRSILGRRLADTPNGSTGVAEVSVTPQIQCAVGMDPEDILALLGSAQRPIDVPPHMYEHFRGAGLTVRSR